MTGVFVRTALVGILGALSSAASNAEHPSTRIVATTFGLRGDGTTDDGPAIARMVTAAARAQAPVELVFPEDRVVRVESAPGRYVLRFHRASHVTIEGGGCTFLLAPRIRFLRLTESSHFVLRNARIDFRPLPFADGTVVSVDPLLRHIDVRLDAPCGPDEASPLPVGGPTREDGEQAFFGMLWSPGPYGLVTDHYWLQRTVRLPDASRTVRARADDRFRRFERIAAGRTRVSLPVPGVAHRYGPGACVEIFDNDTVLVEDVELWSAPWFGFRVFRNRGRVTFRRVHIRPRPGTRRLTSTWRDGFHVKGNRGELRWEDCVLSGMNDDAFNISHHTSRVRDVRSPTTIVVLQTYPLNLMPWHAGEEIVAADHDTRTLIGSSRIGRVEPSEARREIDGQPAATPVTLELEAPIPGLRPGAMVWEPAWTNPDTRLVGCRIENSCRLQSPVALESCDVTALLWFYAERIEGPFPNRFAIRDSTLRRGRGNPTLALSVVGRSAESSAPSAVHDVLLEGNRISGTVSIAGVDRLRLVNNRFLEPGARIQLDHNRGVQLERNRDADGKPWPAAGDSPAAGR